MVAHHLPLTSAMLVLGTVLLLLGRRWFKRDARTWLTSGRRFRWAHLLVGGAVVWAIITSVLLLWGEATGRSPAFQPRLLRLEHVAPFAAVASLVALKASVEELIFRGWLIQQIAAFSSSAIVPIGVSALAFALLHLDFDLTRLAQLSCMGLALGWAAWRLAGIEFTVGAHAAANLALTAFRPSSTHFATEAEAIRLGLPQNAVGVWRISEAPLPSDWLVMSLSMTVAIVATAWLLAARDGKRFRA